MTKKEKYLSVAQLAKILGISRIAVYKKIIKGEIEAFKIGRSFIIPQEELGKILGEILTKKQKKIIDKGIEKTIKEYGETLKLLGQE
jgi:excisionase family DNA binding protein